MLLSLCLTVAAIAWSCTVFAQGTGKAEYEVYPCRYKPVRDVEKLLTDLLPNDPSVHLVVDEKSNSLLLRGPAEAQKIATTLLQQVDRAAAVPATPQPDTAVVKAYDVPAVDLDRWSGVVRALCGQRDDVRVTTSRETRQVIVLAPPELHAAIATADDTGDSVGLDCGHTQTGGHAAAGGRRRTAGLVAPGLGCRGDGAAIDCPVWSSPANGPA